MAMKPKGRQLLSRTAGIRCWRWSRRRAGLWTSSWPSKGRVALRQARVSRYWGHWRRYCSNEVICLYLVFVDDALVQCINALAQSVTNLHVLVDASNANHALLAQSVTNLHVLVNRRLPTTPPSRNSSVSDESGVSMSVSASSSNVSMSV